MLGGIGPWELMIILAIVVVMFGAKKLPMIGDGMGKMITNFRRATRSDAEPLEEGAKTIESDKTKDDDVA